MIKTIFDKIKSFIKETLWQVIISILLLMAICISYNASIFLMTAKVDDVWTVVNIKTPFSRHQYSRKTSGWKREVIFQLSDGTQRSRTDITMQQEKNLFYNVELGQKFYLLNSDCSKLICQPNYLIKGDRPLKYWQHRSAYFTYLFEKNIAVIYLFIYFGLCSIVNVILSTFKEKGLSTSASFWLRQTIVTISVFVFFLHLIPFGVRWFLITLFVQW